MNNHSESKGLFKAYVQIIKPKMVLMILLTILLGFYLADGFVKSSLEVLLYTLLGSTFVAVGSFALNQYLEVDLDSLMERTKNRALPNNIISSNTVLLFGVLTSVMGTVFLAHFVDFLTAFLAFNIYFLYALIYTPMKRVTWWNTTVGALSGAIPPLIGWAAATGGLSQGAWALFLIVFVWQHPHFYAIGWLYREDYANAKIQVLPAMEGKRELTFILTIATAIILIPVSLLPAIDGTVGSIYIISATVAGFMFLWHSIGFVRDASKTTARTLLRSSLVYLTVIVVFGIVDRIDSDRRQPNIKTSALISH